MSQPSRPPLDFDAIRLEAEAAARHFLDHEWDAYMERVRRVEALPENQSGADKGWVDRATEIHRAHYRRVRKSPDAWTPEADSAGSVRENRVFRPDKSSMTPKIVFSGWISARRRRKSSSPAG